MRKYRVRDTGMSAKKNKKNNAGYIAFVCLFFSPFDQCINSGEINAMVFLKNSTFFQLLIVKRGHQFINKESLL